MTISQTKKKKKKKKKKDQVCDNSRAIHTKLSYFLMTKEESIVVNAQMGSFFQVNFESQIWQKSIESQ